MARLAEGAKERGELRSECDVMLLATGIWSIYHTTLMIAVVTDFREVPAAMRLFDDLLRQLLNGVRVVVSC